MFRGSFAHTVDPKGRVSVPAKFRDLIFASNDDRVVITNFRSESTPCLDVHPYPAWLRLEERMNQRPQFNPKVQAFTHYYISNAQECQVDKQGRILLPPLLRGYAQLGDTVMFTGVGSKFQVWDHQAWKQVFDRSESAIFEDAKGFFSDFEF
jgi:MraZ protein